MTEDQAIEILKGRTSLEVHPEAIRSAVRSQPGDLDEAVKQVIDWFVTGESRSKKAGVLLLAALRSQARTPAPTRERNCGYCAGPCQYARRRDPQVEALLAALPGYNRHQVYSAVVSIGCARVPDFIRRTFAVHGQPQMPALSLTPEDVAEKVQNLYRHEAVIPQPDATREAAAQ